MAPKSNRVGLPYLTSSLKMKWDSTSSLEDGELQRILELLVSYLADQGAKSDDDTTYAVFGLQEVFDAMFSSSTTVVLIDSKSISPSAVKTSLGLFIKSCSEKTKTYSVPGLAHMLETRLQRPVDAIALLDETAPIVSQITTRLIPVDILEPEQKPRALSEAVIIRSIGKKSKNATKK